MWHGGFKALKHHFNIFYPLVIYSGFSHWKWWFSIAMLNYQMVHVLWCHAFVMWAHPMQETTLIGSSHKWEMPALTGNLWRNHDSGTSNTEGTWQWANCLARNSCMGSWLKSRDGSADCTSIAKTSGLVICLRNREIDRKAWWNYSWIWAGTLQIFPSILAFLRGKSFPHQIMSW